MAVRRRDRGHEQEESRQHGEHEQPAQPLRRDPEKRRGRLIVGDDEEQDGADGQCGEEAAERPLPHAGGDRTPEPRAGDAEMGAEPDQRGEDEQGHHAILGSALRRGQAISSAAASAHQMISGWKGSRAQ